MCHSEPLTRKSCSEFRVDWSSVEFNIQPCVVDVVEDEEQRRVSICSPTFHHKGDADCERRWEVFLAKRGVGVAAIGVTLPVVVKREVEHLQSRAIGN